MSKVEEVEDAVKQLSAEELSQFRTWFAEYDALAWDRQLEADLAAGRLDHLIGEALRDHREGRTTEL